MSSPILEVRNLSAYYPVRGLNGLREIKALDGVSFKLQRGETIGVAGGAGSGKSTLARTIMRLIAPEEGRIIYDGDDITTCELGPYRPHIQMVFQDADSALDPNLTALDLIAEPLDINTAGMEKSERLERVNEQMRLVGLDTRVSNRFPDEMTPEQRQLTALARGLVLKPDVLILDEPVCGMDMTAQARIIDALAELQRQTGISYVFMSRDLAMIRHFAHSAIVLYEGRMVESAPTGELFSNPAHPFSQLLIGTFDAKDPFGQRAPAPEIKKAELGGAAATEEGCPYWPHCAIAAEECRNMRPALHTVGKGHMVACEGITTKRRT